MNLHKAILYKSFKYTSDITPEMLDVVNDNNDSVWHHLAAHKLLKDIPKHLFTNEVLAKVNLDGNSVWHFAACNNGLKYIPIHLFTDEALSKVNDSGINIWYLAARCDGLKEIPVHLFNKDILNKQYKYGDNIFHVAAEYGTLGDIPEELFSNDAIYIHNNKRYNVWHQCALHNTLQSMPIKFITKDLLDMEVFGSANREYINHVLQMPDRLQDFISNNEHLAKDVEFRDLRLEVKDVFEDKVVFRFKGIKSEIILTQDGAFLNSENFNSLNHVVSFIQNTYSDVEQSFSFPQTENIEIAVFSL